MLQGPKTSKQSSGQDSPALEFGLLDRVGPSTETGRLHAGLRVARCIKLGPCPAKNGCEKGLVIVSF